MAGVTVKVTDQILTIWPADEWTGGRWKTKSNQPTKQTNKHGQQTSHSETARPHFQTLSLAAVLLEPDLHLDTVEPRVSWGVMFCGPRPVMLWSPAILMACIPAGLMPTSSPPAPSPGCPWLLSDASCITSVRSGSLHHGWILFQMILLLSQASSVPEQNAC